MQLQTFIRRHHLWLKFSAALIFIGYGYVLADMAWSTHLPALETLGQIVWGIGLAIIVWAIYSLWKFLRATR